MRLASLLVSVLVGVGLTALTISSLGAEPERSVFSSHTESSNRPDSILTVCLSGSCDFIDIQSAVDNSQDGDQIKVAAGTYTGDSGHGSVVFLGKDLILSGGYDEADFDAPPNPLVNPTIIDAENQRRGIHVSGEFSVTIEGFRITNGNYESHGGGISIFESDVVVKNNWIYSNTSYTEFGGCGGGIRSTNANVEMIGNKVYSNTVPGVGGGACLGVGEHIIVDNVFSNNQAVEKGGGLLLGESGGEASWSLVKGNTFISNTADGSAGLALDTGHFYVIDNLIQDNSSGGIGVNVSSTATISNNSIISNVYSGVESYG
ncbi:MAG: right-handed parallel beta-helix repeat-containing protein, partial [Candidatus Promineifilaceae bacterium]